MAKIKGIEVTIGCDPEVFLYDKDANVFVSAHDLIPGDKKNPHKLDKGAVQVDGLALEFNIDPAHTSDEFEDNILTVVRQIRKMVPKKYLFACVPYVHFSKKYMEGIPAEAKILGCDPDYNMRGQLNPNPSNMIGNIRTSSGHVHVGWGENFSVDPNSGHFKDCKMLSSNIFNAIDRSLDAYDSDNSIRKDYYGMQGAFRPKPYGIEYRGLSSMWVSKPHLYKDIFESFVSVFADTVEGMNYSVDRHNKSLPIFNKVMFDMLEGY